MNDPNGTHIPLGNQATTLPAGYTYFGQFIDHDLTRDETYLGEAGKLPPAETFNGGGGLLDLDHLYGEGPGSEAHSHLYARDHASFLLGETRLANGEEFDLAINDKGEPQSADERSSENIILRQLCVLFMKLHNRAVADVPASMPASERFEAARRRVRWQYQWTVRWDYLFRICTAKVYRALIGDGKDLPTQVIDWENDGFAIPVEFSLAAFRFGHSMVRPTYNLNNDTVRAPLESLFWDPGKAGPLDPALHVNWNAFLGPNGEQAMAIDTVLAPPLFHLPPEHVHHLIRPGAPPLPPELAVRTLLRGHAVAVPSGEFVAERLGREPLRGPKPPHYAVDPWQRLDDYGFNNATPLWYYVLLEAELEERGKNLGTVGSQLVGEVLEGALRTDASSFLRQNRAGWRPEPWSASDGRSVTINWLLDIAKLVGLADWR